MHEDNLAMFINGIVLASGLLQSLFALLLWRQHALEKHWGLNWLGFSMLTAALTNVERLIRTELGSFPVFVSSTATIFEFVFGFLSLSALLSGTLIYTGRHIRHPIIWNVICAAIIAVIAIGLISMGLSSGGRWVAMSVFISAGVLAIKAHQTEPRSGFLYLASVLLSYPLIVITLLVADGWIQWMTAIAAVIYALIGALLLTVVLGRRTIALHDAAKEARLSKQETLLLNQTLEARVHDRTAALESTLQHLQSTQEKLIQQEKLASLGALVTGVAHELNTPIGNAVTMVSTLEEQTDQIQQKLETALRKEELAEYLVDMKSGSQIVSRNLQRAVTLINSFKQLSTNYSEARVEYFQLVSVTSEASNAVAPLLAHRPQKLIVNVPTHIAMESYPSVLVQIILHLLNNALVHAFDGDQPGEISLSANYVDDETEVEIKVCDNGRGMSEEVLKHIYDPFFTTRLGQGGSGLGLNLVHNKVSGLLGGSIDIASSEGKGTQVSLRIPTRSWHSS